MTDDEPRFLPGFLQEEVPCIKCGVVDIRGDMLPLRWGFHDKKSAEEILKHPEPCCLAWVHDRCWRDYDAMIANLILVNKGKN